MGSQRVPTMRDVADRAGVSIKTVSRVVNGETGVSSALAERVEEAIDELGYRIDQRASFLRQSSSSTSIIGFVLVDVANQFFGTLLRGIDEVATERGCLVLSGSTDRSADREHQLVEAFLDHRVDGLIVVYSGSGSVTSRPVEALNTPIVFVDLEPDDTERDIVRTDHYAGARAATEHLLRHGHTDVAFFGDDPKVSSATLRAEGFIDAMSEAGIGVPERRMVTGSYDQDEWGTIAREYFARESPPTAVFTSQNIITVGATIALHELGLHDDVAQVGFDDVDLARAVDPALTVVPQDPLSMGRRAAELLFARIDGEPSPPIHELVVPGLIVRGSGEILPPRS